MAQDVVVELALQQVGALVEAVELVLGVLVLAGLVGDAQMGED